MIVGSDFPVVTILPWPNHTAGFFFDTDDPNTPCKSLSLFILLTYQFMSVSRINLKYITNATHLHIIQALRARVNMLAAGSSSCDKLPMPRASIYGMNSSTMVIWLTTYVHSGF